MLNVSLSLGRLVPVFIRITHHGVNLCYLSNVHSPSP